MMFRTLLPFLFVAPPLAYQLISVWCGRAFFRAPRPGRTYFPPVTILKPVKGTDAESYENFASFCTQRYPEFQIVFAVADSDDPAVPVIRRIIADFPECDIELVIDPRTYGPNYKVANLVNAFPRARHGIIIVCDSDIRVPPGYLADVCSRFENPEVGLVTSLYRCSRVPNLATAFEATGFTSEMIPNVMVAMRLEGLSFALGASMAVRREALGKIGGFVSLAPYLADDYQLGNRVHRAGYRIELSDEFVESMMKPESLASILTRQIRWGRTMRVSRPGGYFASGITQSFPMAFAALAVSGWSAAGVAAAVFLYLARFAVCTIYSRCWVRDRLFPRLIPLLPVRDFLSFVTWGLAFAGNRVRWRGNQFRLLPDGTLREMPEPAGIGRLRA